MFRTLATLCALVLLSSSAVEARIILIDDFDTPTQGAHDSDGSSREIPSPPNFFSTRLNDASGNSNLSITNGNLAATVLGGNPAFLEWAGSSTSATMDRLILTNFNGPVLNGLSYEVSVNGTAVGNGVVDDGRFRFAATTVGPNDRMRITFTAESDGLGIFQGASMLSTPEPTAIGLLGLVMFGGTCRYRRRRVTTA